MLAVLPTDLEQIADDVAEVDDWLSDQKGYGLFGLNRKQRLMHAAMLVSGAYIGRDSGQVMSTATISGTISLLAAQQAVMCAAIAASAAAANASN